MQTLIYNATLILPDRLIENGWLMIENGRIAGLGEKNLQPATAIRMLDARDSYLLPGLIDLHCDAIEKTVEPRPEVHFELPIALAEMDRRLASAGITTEFHAITLDDHEFGVRSTGFVRELALVLNSNFHGLVRHQIHARLEVTSQNGFEIISELIRRKEVRLISLMDHSPGQGQYSNEQAFRKYIKRTTHSSDEDIDRLIAAKQKQKALIPYRVEVVTGLAREAGITIATHDDDTAEKVSEGPKLGVHLIEFPTTMEAARKAHELGLAVCMGAPNVVRGKSSGGNISAIDSIKAGFTDVLCADYYPSAMLSAPFKLVQEHILSLPEAVKMVTLNPARAVELDKDFGSLEVGKVADLILVDANHHKVPYVESVFVGGQEKLSHYSKARH